MKTKILLFEEQIKRIIMESEYGDSDTLMDDDMVIERPRKEEWNPLYEWLEPIFGEKYIKAADNFMIMGKVTLPNHGNKKLYIYKHVRARKNPILLDESGWPYHILEEKVPNTKYDTKNIGVKRISNKQAFDEVYSQLIEWIKDAEAREAKGEVVCVDGVCMKPSFFQDAKEYWPLLLKQLQQAGYKVLSTTNNPEKIVKQNPDIFGSKD